MKSLRVRLIALWLLSALACTAVALLLIQMSRQSSEAQIGRSQAIIARACDLIAKRLGGSAEGSGPSTASEVAAALADQDGVEGGVWQAGGESLAYAFPTYQGAGPKTDLPQAEGDRIAAINAEVARTGQPAHRRLDARAQTLLLAACPVPGDRTTAWTMARVQAVPGYAPLRLGLGVLFALMVAMTAWLGRMLFVWTRHLRGIEAALGDAGASGMPSIPRTGERELDRIVNALNEAGARLADARSESDALASRVARSERLASLGRVAAGVAHEIRNPVAAARLQGENALAGDDERRRVAIGEMLGQIDRLDGLVDELLAMTQRAAPVLVEVSTRTLIAAAMTRNHEWAARKSVCIVDEGPDVAAVLDPAMTGRILDNLLGNAIRHSPDGGRVVLRTKRDCTRLSIEVEDSGAGVPEPLRDRLFEPFVTSRADGTGLGLAIARELADAHGGTVSVSRFAGASQGQGAIFSLELPQEAPCRPS